MFLYSTRHQAMVNGYLLYRGDLVLARSLQFHVISFSVVDNLLLMETIVLISTG